MGVDELKTFLFFFLCNSKMPSVCFFFFFFFLEDGGNQSTDSYTDINLIIWKICLEKSFNLWLWKGRGQVS